MLQGGHDAPGRARWGRASPVDDRHPPPRKKGRVALVTDAGGRSRAGFALEPAPTSSLLTTCPGPEVGTSPIGAWTTGLVLARAPGG
jgi:hypothetical protein